jgi:hypothetical protein
MHSVDRVLCHKTRSGDEKAAVLGGYDVGERKVEIKVEMRARLAAKSDVCKVGKDTAMEYNADSIRKSV